MNPQRLTFNGDFHSSGNLNFEIAGTGTELYDVLTINGNADFTGWDSLTVNFNGLNANLGTNFTFDSSGAHLSITPVPEPETYAMLLAGLGLLSFAVRRRKETYTTNEH